MTDTSAPTAIDPTTLREAAVTILVDFDVGHLEIPGELLGKKIDFKESGRDVQIRLPDASRVGKSFEAAVWQSGSHGERVFFSVGRLKIALFPSATPALPQLESERIALMKADSGKFNEVRAIAEESAPFAYRAFDRWAHTLRWKAMNPWICRQNNEVPTDGWQAAVVDRADETRIQGTGSHSMTVLPDSITIEQWEETEQALREDAPVPVYVDLLLDAERHFGFGDTNRGLVDAASASEIFMKQRVLEALPVGVNTAVITHIERTNVNLFRARLFPALLVDGKRNTSWKEIVKNLEDLAEARNEVIHGGKRSNADKATAAKFTTSVRKLFRL